MAILLQLDASSPVMQSSRRHISIRILRVLLAIAVIMLVCGLSQHKSVPSAPTRLLYADSHSSGWSADTMGPVLVPDRGFGTLPVDGGAHRVYAAGSSGTSSVGQLPPGRSVGTSWTPSSDTKNSFSKPTPEPTAAPTAAPTRVPTSVPTAAPTHRPTPAPTHAAVATHTAAAAMMKHIFPPTEKPPPGSGSLRNHGASLDEADLMIAGSVALVVSLFCCGCFVKKYMARSGHKGACPGMHAADEESPESKHGVPWRGGDKVDGHEYSYSYKDASTTKSGKESSASGPSVDQALRGSAQETRGLLTPDDEEKGTGDPALRAEAAREVERILAAPNQMAVLGGGAKQERTATFRKLARMLHPDKGLVEGDRAALALRRIVEAHRALAAQH